MSAFMLKEIAEQPEAIRRTLEQHRSDHQLDAVLPALKSATKIVVAASGSSRHAGLAGEIMLEDLADIACDVEYASEYSYRRPRMSTTHVIMVITQSGETGDTLLAMREALARGAKTVAIANVENSTIARESTAAIITNAGKEVAIPATKSFTTQLTALYLFALKLARLRGALPEDEIVRRLADIEDIPRKLQENLEAANAQALAAAQANFGSRDFVFLGRGIHYAIAREGALKLKEVSLVHAEALPAGELRHGPQALIDSSLPLVLLATRDRNDDGSTLRYEKSPTSWRSYLEAQRNARRCTTFCAAYSYEQPISIRNPGQCPKSSADPISLLHGISRLLLLRGPSYLRLHPVPPRLRDSRLRDSVTL